MSTIKKKTSHRKQFNIEFYNSAMEVAEKCRTRQITDDSFEDMQKAGMGSWRGVKSYDEALELMANGYQPTVENMRGVFKASRSGESTRFAFKNEITGFAPIVPLALNGVPNCMMNMRMNPIKAKVVDIYYDMTSRRGVDSDTIIKAGQELLGAIVELERQGYRFNLYGVQTYYDGSSCDMLVVKTKSAGQPLDLKRVSFPLTHTAFFRVIGFDWYSKVPGGKHRSGYGHGIAYDYSNEKLQEFAKDLFGGNPVYFSAAKIEQISKEHIKEVINNGGKN